MTDGPEINRMSKMPFNTSFLLFAFPDPVPAPALLCFCPNPATFFWVNFFLGVTPFGWHFKKAFSIAALHFHSSLVIVVCEESLPHTSLHPKANGNNCHFLGDLLIPKTSNENCWPLPQKKKVQRERRLKGCPQRASYHVPSPTKGHTKKYKNPHTCATIVMAAGRAGGRPAGRLGRPGRPKEAMHNLLSKFRLSIGMLAKLYWLNSCPALTLAHGGNEMLQDLHWK